MQSAGCLAGWTEDRLREKMGEVVAQCKDTDFYYLTVLWKACERGIPRIKTSSQCVYVGI